MKFDILTVENNAKSQLRSDEFDLETQLFVYLTEFESHREFCFVQQSFV